MTRSNVECRVYRNGKCKAVLPNENEAFEYLKRSALRHKKADFIIERREIIFDSRENLNDKKRLNGFRSPSDNAIHASIHMQDREIGSD